ncbi:unnamed protein product [Rotaria sordida]|uniref:Uncharacterized protein n=2 Tax=Rotaria sordida TaxID=392033 RepID=A0A819GIK9_9BILA|nr:unnamed protein product [Rotaria sordida]
MIHIILLFCFVSVESSHFYGGTVTWRPMSNTDTSSKVSILFTQSYQWRRSYGSATFCDQTIITNQSPKLVSGSDTLQCTTTPSSACGSYSSIDIGEYCTDFSTIVDSSSGQISTLQNITAGSKFCVAFQGTAWIGLQSTNCVTGRKKRWLFGSASTTKRTTVSTTTGATCYSTSAAWSIGCCVDLTFRSDGIINTPPVATILSPIQVTIDTVTNITIPVIDADNDYTRTPPLYMIKSSLVQVGTTNTWEITETWTPRTLQIGSQVYCAVTTDSLNIQSEQYCLTFTVVAAGSSLACPGDVVSSTNAAASNAGTGVKSNDAWIIALSVLGFLSLLGLCCCCWWCLFAKGRRRRTDKEKNNISKDLSMNEQNSDPLESSFSTERQLESAKKQNYPKKKKTKKSIMTKLFDWKNSISTISEPTTNSTLMNLPHPSSTFSISKDTSYQPKSNMHSMSYASVTRVSLIDKPLASEENKNIKLPNVNDDIELTKTSTKKNSSSKIIRLSRGNSIGPYDNSIKASKLALSSQPNTQITDELFSKTQSTGSVSVSRVNQSSLPNKNSLSHMTNDGLLPVNKGQTAVTSTTVLPQSNVASHMPNEGNVKVAKLSKSINIQKNLLHTSSQKQHGKANVSNNGVKNISVTVSKSSRGKLSTNT